MCDRLMPILWYTTRHRRFQEYARFLAGSADMISNFKSPADNVNARAQRSRMRILDCTDRCLHAARACFLYRTVGSVKSREIRTQLKSALHTK